MRDGRFVAAIACFLGASLVAPSGSELQLVFSSLEVPGAVLTNAQGINARGDIVGFYTDAAGLNHGFRWSRGVYSAIDVPNARITQARGIGPNGQIVGTSPRACPCTTEPRRIVV